MRVCVCVCLCVRGPLGISFPRFEVRNAMCAPLMERGKSKTLAPFLTPPLSLSLSLSLSLFLSLSLSLFLSLSLDLFAKS